MPIYEYECQKCGHVTSLLQKISDKAPEDCSECGAKHSLVKKVSHSSFILKGGGWFKDCYPDAKHSGSSNYTEKSDSTSSEHSDHTGGCCSSCPASKDCPSATSASDNTSSSST